METCPANSDQINLSGLFANRIDDRLPYWILKYLAAFS